MKFRFSPYLASLATVAVVLAGVWFLDRSEQQRFQQRNRADVLHQLSATRARLEGELNQRLFLMRGLVAYISAKNPDISQEEFETLTGVIVAEHTGIPSAALFKNSIATHLYPLAGQEEALGFDPMKIPEEREAFERAINTRRTVLSGPVKLVAQDNRVFITRTPIFLTPKKSAPERGRYWGMVSIGIDMDILLKQAGLLDSNSQLQYAIRGKDGLGAKGEIFFGEATIFQRNPAILEVTLPNGSWQLAAIPVKGWLPSSPVRVWLLIGGGIVALLMGVLVFKWVRDPMRLRQSVERATHALSQSEAKYRELVENASSIILRIDPQGNITFFNEFAQNFFGYSEEEILGKKASNTIVPRTDSSGKDLQAMLDDVLQHPERYVDNENENIRRNGDRVWIAWRNKPLFTEAGSFAGMLCIGTDISDRKQAEERLQKAKDQLEIRVQERTAELTQTLEELRKEIVERSQAEQALRESEGRERERAKQLEETLLKLQRTQAQLVQTEKMSSLGQLVAGIAHEINNPVNFIQGNLTHVDNYANDLLALIETYQREYSQPNAIIQNKINEIDLNFITADLDKILASLKGGCARIQQIVLSLRNFSRLDEADMKAVDIHTGIDSTLLILQNRLKGDRGRFDIQIVKEYGDLPKVDCYASQMNQVFMNILTNAIDALEIGTGNRGLGAGYWELGTEANKISDFQVPIPTIRISTQVREAERAIVEITDNGIGINESIKLKIFDPFFTTKEVGKGTGLGLSIAYQIVVEKHGGKLECFSEVGRGTTFQIEIPIRQNGG